MEITCTATEDDIFDAVASLPDPTTFILGLDELIADEGFTIDLMSRLAESMFKEYEATERHYTEQLLNMTFGDDQASSPWGPLPHHLEGVTKQRQTMEEVVRLLKDLS